MRLKSRALQSTREATIGRSWQSSGKELCKVKSRGRREGSDKDRSRAGI